jgi:hypothetical protein
MTEPTQPIPPTEPTASTFQQKLRDPDALRLGAVAAAALVLLVSAAAAIGASPSPSSGAGASPGTSSAPGSNADPDAEKGDRDGRGWHRIFGRGHLGPAIGRGFGMISITAISGSNVSLETANGWTRTIAVTDDVTITKGGEEIALGDLAVGDRVGLRERRSDDGTFTVTDIVVVLPIVAGEVSAKTESTITVTRRDGSSATIHVDGGTTYRVGRDGDATLADVEVGMVVIAEGTQRDDGSLDASAVRAGMLRRRMDGGFPWRPGPGLPELPEDAPAA